MEVTIKNNQRLIRINQQKINKVLRKTLQYLKDNGKLNSLLVAHYLSLELSVLFVNDKKMKDLNLQYRGKDKTTDVLSFPQQDRDALSVMRNELKENVLDASRITHHALLSLGDIVINLHQAKRQALEQGVTFYEEVTRLLIHGLLHLLGYDHEKNKYQAKKMEEMERELLFMFLCSDLPAYALADGSA